jgi:hypothetical protein
MVDGFGRDGPDQAIDLSFRCPSHRSAISLYSGHARNRRPPDSAGANLSPPFACRFLWPSVSLSGQCPLEHKTGHHGQDSFRRSSEKGFSAIGLSNQRGRCGEQGLLSMKGPWQEASKRRVRRSGYWRIGASAKVAWIGSGRPVLLPPPRFFGYNRSLAGSPSPVIGQVAWPPSGNSIARQGKGNHALAQAG